MRWQQEAALPIGGLIQLQCMHARIVRSSLRKHQQYGAKRSCGRRPRALYRTHALRCLVLCVQHADRCPCSQQPLGMRIVLVRGLQARYSAAVVALALDELVAFTAEQRQGGCCDFAGEGVEGMTGERGGNGAAARRGGDCGCRQMRRGAKGMRAHVTSEQQRLPERHFTVGAADVRNSRKLAFAFVAARVGEEGGGGGW